MKPSRLVLKICMYHRCSAKYGVEEDMNGSKFSPAASENWCNSGVASQDGGCYPSFLQVPAGQGSRVSLPYVYVC